MGEDCWLTVHPDDLARIKNEFEQLFNEDGLVRTVAYRYRCKDGGYKDIELTAVNLVRDPNIKGILTNYQDVTERNKRGKRDPVPKLSRHAYRAFQPPFL